MKEEEISLEASEALAAPERKDTLLEKAEKRSRRQFLKQKVIGLSPEFLIGTGEIAGLIGVVALNFFCLLPFFGQEQQALTFSAPLIPVLAKIISPLMPYSYGVRFWLVLFMLFLPVSLYFFVREISKRRLTAFIASLIVILPVGIFLPLRVRLGLLFEDGGQVASLTLTILVCQLLLRFLRKGGFKIGLASSLTASLVALTSPLGLFILLYFMLTLTFSEMLLSQGRLKLFRLLTVLLLAGGFSAFWYNPKFAFLIVNSYQGELIRKTLVNLFPLSFFLVPLLGAVGFLLFENRPELQPLFLALFLSIGFGFLSLGTGLQLSSPSRFLPSLGVAGAFLGGVLLTGFFDFVRGSASLKKFRFLDEHRRLASSLLVFLFIFFSLATVEFSGRGLRELEEGQVLGLGTIKKTGIWEMRKQTQGFFVLIGNLISLAAVGLVVFLGTRIRERSRFSG